MGMINAGDGGLAQAKIKVVSVRFFTVCMFVLLCAEMWTMPIALVWPKEETEGHKSIIEWLKKHDETTVA